MSIENSIARKTQEICGVEGCEKLAERSVYLKMAKKAALSLKVENRRIHLCKDHYKAFKKATRIDRDLEKLGR